MSLKPGTGAVTQHATRHQTGSGPGAKNTPLKKSAVNPPAPFYEDAKPVPKGVKQPPQATEKKGNNVGRNTVLLSGAKAHKEHSSTFQAPRSAGSSDPVMTGYTKPGKM